jgi:hypothetical protein
MYDIDLWKQIIVEVFRFIYPSLTFFQTSAHYQQEIVVLFLDC